jgi:hypothetical protein
MTKRMTQALHALPLLLIPLLAGCAHQQPRQFDPASFNSPGMERSLQYWTANFSSHSTNHFYVCATELDRGELVRALVYFREEGRILDYLEEPSGAEARSWRLRPMVDRDAVLSDEKVGISNDLVPHRVWVRWMQQCITSGREYVVTLSDAKAAFPESKGPN